MMKAEGLAHLSEGSAGDRKDVMPSVFWTFELVQERLVEALLLMRRMPDREHAWLKTKTMSLWQQVSPTAGMNAVERADYLRIDRDERPRMPGLTRHEVAEMEEALGWMRFVGERDRKLVGLAIGRLARGDRHVPWRELLQPMGMARGSDGLRMRYGRAINAICVALNPAGKLRGHVSR